LLASLELDRTLKRETKSAMTDLSCSTVADQDKLEGMWLRGCCLCHAKGFCSMSICDAECACQHDRVSGHLNNAEAAQGRDSLAVRSRDEKKGDELCWEDTGWAVGDEIVEVLSIIRLVIKLQSSFGPPPLHFNEPVESSEILSWSLTHDSITHTPQTMSL